MAQSINIFAHKNITTDAYVQQEVLEKIYCEYDAPNPEAIREHGRLSGIPVDKISEVALEVSPDMFH